MQLPELHDWENTRDGLHQAAQVLSAFRKAYIQPQPNALHLALYVSRRGVTTGATSAGSFELNFGGGMVHHVAPDGTETPFSINGHTQRTLAEALLESTRKNARKTDTDFVQEYKPPQSEAKITVAEGQAAEYARALYQIYTGITRFRARLSGTMSPVVVWAHGFDLSTLWFKGHNPDEHKEAHLNFGFSPGSTGIPRPYLYAYAWPLPEGLLDVELPAPARWHTEGWTGARVDYDDLHTENDPEQVVEELFRAIHALMAAKL